MITYKKIKPYIKKGLIREEKHPEFENIRIFNYTNQCQFDRKWDDITMNCRGLILDINADKIIARGFTKFFNYSEYIERGDKIPNETPFITEKIDGSLIIHSQINGKDYLSTRGSFVSEQAIWATNWWKQNIKDNIYQEGYTHLFEVCYPENQIVVRYDFSGLVYLGSIENETGKTKIFNIPNSIKTLKKIENTDLSKLLEMDEPNSEGFVIYYPVSNLRLKIKFPQYIKLHKVVTGLSSIGIWELLKSGQEINNIIESMPDEFFKWAKSVADDLSKKYNEIDLESSKNVNEVKKLPTRKEQALEIMKCKYPGVCFKKLDNENYSEIIWKLIRPKNKQICQN